MSLFISDAWAQAGSAAEPSALEAFLPIIFIFGIFYLLLIRPQQKKAKQHQTMVDAIGKGDEVITNGGILGKITELGEGYVAVKIDDNVVVKVQRSGISTVLPKGTIKTVKTK